MIPYLPALVSCAVEGKILPDPTIHLVQGHLSPVIDRQFYWYVNIDKQQRSLFIILIKMRKMNNSQWKCYKYVHHTICIPCGSYCKTYKCCIWVGGLQTLIHWEVFILREKGVWKETFRLGRKVSAVDKGIIILGEKWLDGRLYTRGESDLKGVFIIVAEWLKWGLFTGGESV